MKKYLLPIVLLLFAIAHKSSAQVSFDLTKTADLATCTPGTTVIYTILYSCSSLTDPCNGATVTDALPAQFEFVSALGTTHTSSAVYNAGTHSVVFTFLSTIPAGTTGQLKVVVKAKTGLPPGSIATTNCPVGAVTNVGGTVTSSCANVTINVPAPVNLFTITKVKASPTGTPYLGRDVTYDISVCNPANAAQSGGVNLVGAVVTDVLPTNAVFVSATSGGVYSGGNVTWNLGTLIAGNTASCTKVSVTVRYPIPPFAAGNSVTNTSSVTGTSNGSAITIGPATATHTLLAPVSLWTVAKAKITPSGQAFLGNNVTYELSLCNPANGITNGNVDILNTVMIDTLPVGATYVSSTLSGVYNATNRTVTWNLGDQLASNTAFCSKRQVVINYPVGVFSSGATVCNGSAVFGNRQGFANGAQIGASRACHTVITFVPNCNASVSKSISSATNVVGDVQTYTINFNNTGNMPLDNFTFIDNIPNAINLTQIQTGAYNGSAFTIAVSYQTNVSGTYTAWTGSPFSSATNSTLSVASLGLGANYITKVRFQFSTIPTGFVSTQNLKIQGTLINPANGGAAVNNGDIINNCGDIDWDCNGSHNGNQSCSSFSVDPFVAAPAATVSKTRLNASLDVGGTQEYSFALANTGNTALTNYILNDPIPLNVKFSRVETGLYSGPATPIIVKYTKNSTGATVQTWPFGPYSSITNSVLNVSDLGLIATDYVTNIKIEYGTVPVGWASTTSPKVVGSVINPGSSGVSIAQNATVSNIATLNYSYGASNYAPTSTASFIFVTPPLPNVTDIEPSKSVINGVGPFATGDTVRFQIQVKTGSSLINPIVADLLPLGMTYKPNTWRYGTSGGNVSPNPPIPNIQVIPNYNNTGRTLVRWSWTNMTATGGINATYTLPANQRFQIEYSGIVTASSLAGTNTNPVAVLTNDMNIKASSSPCKSSSKVADTQDLDGDGDFAENLCQCSCVNFTVASTASLTSVKWDRGELDATWLKYPSVASTVPGGTVDYQFRVKNTGNVSMKNIVIVDVLPYIGDKGVVLASFNRLSEWRPVLIAPINAPAGVKVYYSTEQNPCRDELRGANPSPFPSGCVPNSWSLIPPALITDVQAVKFDFGTMVMSPADEIILDWKMIAPPSAPQNNEVAWNSFGYVSTRVDDNTTLLPAEPIKVGIRIQPPPTPVLGDRVWLDTNMDGIQNNGEAGVDGVTVDLYKDNGDGVADIVNDLYVSSKMTFDGGLYSWSNLPAGGYFVVFHIPPTHAISPQNTTLDDQDSDGTSLISGNEELALTPVVALSVIDMNKTLDQGIFPQPVGALGGYVWADTNTNAVQDEGVSEGLNGVKVKIYKNTSGTANPATDLLIATTTTQPDNAGRPGYYLFDNLVPANYYVVFTLSNGSTFTTRGATGTSDTGDSDPNTSTGVTEITEIASSEVDLTWDAGLIVATGALSLGNIIWNDTNNNGVYETSTGELGINGVLVNLYKDTNSDGVFTAGVDALFKTTTTFTKAGETGYYLFANLPAGDYIVQIDNSNFDTGAVLDGFGSSGSGSAPDPDNNINNDDNGDNNVGNGIVSRAITLTTAGEPINDGDASNNTNLSLDFGVYLVPCNTMSSLAANDVEVCNTSPITQFTVQTNNTDPSGITFLYYTAATTDPYNGAQTGILGAATGNGTSATLSGVTLPNAIATYYIYAILTTTPAAPACRPQAGTTVNVIDCNCHLTTANLTVACHNNGTAIGGSDDYMQITIRPTGQFTGFSGYSYSGALSGTAAYGVTTALQTAPGTAGAGNLSLVITDIDNPTCTLTVPITDPGICSASAGSVGNYAWNDFNNNGINDEPTTAGINGVVVELWNATTSTIVSTTTTANNGSNPGFYNFIVTTSGNYYIQFPTTNNSKILTTQTSTAGINNNSDADLTTGRSPIFAIDTNGTGVAKDNTTIDAGYVCPSGCVPVTILKMK